MLCRYLSNGLQINVSEATENKVCRCKRPLEFPLVHHGRTRKKKPLFLDCRRCAVVCVFRIRSTEETSFFVLAFAANCP